MDGLDDWLDSQDATPLPNTADPGAVDRWLDEPAPTQKINPQDIDNFLDAPADDTGAFMRGFKQSLANQQPEDLANAIEGMQYLTGLGVNEETGQPDLQTAEKLREFAKSGTQYERKVPSFTDIKGPGDALTYALESAGSGIASTLPSLVTGTAGAIAGKRFAGTKGAAIGAIGGAAAPSAEANFGQLFGALKDEGVDPKKAAEWAAGATVPITALDVAAPTSWIARLTGDAKREAVRGLARRIVQEAAKGFAMEGSTEAAQQAIQAGTVGAATEKSPFTWQNAKEVADSFLQGGISGGAMGGAQGVAPDRAAAPAPAPAPSPPAAARPATAAPDAIIIPRGTALGLETPSGILRVRIEAIENGNVFYVDPDGNQFGMPVEDFRGAVRPAPPAADLVRGDATTVAEPPAARPPEPMDYGDINDFDPNAQVERPPAQPSPQQAMELPDTRAIDRAAAAAREFRKAAVEATDAERATYLHQQADALDNEAMDLRRQLAARSDQWGVGVPAAEVRTKAELGPLGLAAPAVSEATTGPIQPTVTQPETPLERAAPAVSEAVTGPVPQRVVAPDTRTELERSAPAVQPAEQPVTVREKPKPTVDQLVRDRSARLNDPQSIAKQTGQTVEEVRAELQRIAGRPNSPIRQVRGKVTVDPKTGQPVQSARAGMLVYAPRRTGPTSLLEALSAAGGVNDTTGDLQSMGADTWHRGRPGTRPLVNRSGIALDELGDWAEANGYLPPRGVDERTGENYHRDPQDVLDLIDRELRGQRQLPLGEVEETEAGPAPTPEERREYELRRDLGRLQETAPETATIEDMETQLEERLAMMNAATVDEAVDMMNADLDALDRIMEENYAGWEPDAAPRAEAAPAVSPDIGRPETVGRPEGAGPARAVDRGAAGRGAAEEIEGGVGGRLASMGDNRPAIGNIPQSGIEKIPGRNEGAAAGQPAGAGSGAEVSGAGGRKGEAVPDAGTGSIPSEKITRDARDNFVDQSFEFDQWASEGGYPETPSGTASAAIEYVLDRGNVTGFEYMVSVNMDDGTFIQAGTSSDDNSVWIGDDTRDSLQSDGRYIRLIHNHPNNSPTSPADISLLGNPGTESVLAVSLDGYNSSVRLSEDAYPFIDALNSSDARLFLQQVAEKALNAAWPVLEKEPVFKHMTNDAVLQVAGIAMNRAMADGGIIVFEDQNLPAFPFHDVIRRVTNAASKAIETEIGQVARGVDGAAEWSGRDIRLAGTGRDAGQAESLSGQRGPEREGSQGGAGQKAASTAGQESISQDTQESVRENGLTIRGLLNRFRRNPGTAKSNAQQVNKLDAMKGPPELRKLSRLSNLISFAATVASKDTISARYYTAEKAMARYAEALVRAGANEAAAYYSDQVGPEGRARINQILEHDRLQGVNRKDTGKRVVVRMPDTYAGQLAKPGEVVTLNTVESRALMDLRKFFDNRWRKFGEAMARQFGWTGPFNEAALNQAIADAEGVRARNQAERALEIFRLVQDMRRAGYVPFARYGDTKIAIRPKPKAVPGKDEMQFNRPVHVELVPTGSATDLIADKVGGAEAGAVGKRRAELEKQYPRDSYDYEVTPLNTLNDVRKVDLPAVEKMFMLVNMKNPDMGPKFYEEIINQIFEERKAGFRKQSHNIPGYSTDFERSIADYIHQTSGVIARMELGKSVNRAYEATQSHQDRDVAKFWKDYREYVETPGDEFSTMRKLAFWSFIWGSPGSALVNLTQTPLVTMPQAMSWAGPKAVPALANAITDALLAVRVGRDGLTIDWNRLGSTPAEKRMIAQLRAEGVLDPIIARDLQGYDRGTSPTNRKWRRRFDRAYEIGASAFNTMEMANRIGAALGAFRLAQSADAMMKAQKVYAGDAEFRQMVGRAGTPTDMARFMVDETQFMGGKRGRPRAMRGAGSLLLQWKQYQANWLRLMFKNMSRMGPEGKLAGSAMLLGLVASAGALGLPFAEDLLDAANWAVKTATGIDPLLERRIGRWLRDVGLGEVGAEVAMRGPSREYLGIDLGSRLGMGQMAPEGSIENAFPLLGATVGKATEFWNRWQSGQPEGALATLMPKGVADIAKGAAVLPDEGYRSQRGDITLFPDEITAGERIARGIGFQPTRFARASEYRYAQRQLAAATQEASTKLLSNVASELALATKAQQAGDETTAKLHADRYVKLLRDNAEQLRNKDLPGWLKIPQPAVKAIRMRLQQIMDFDKALMKRTGKMKREEMLDYPLPTE